MATRRERADLPKLLRVRAGRRHEILDLAASVTHGWDRADAEAVTVETLQRLHDMSVFRSRSFDWKSVFRRRKSTGSFPRPISRSAVIGARIARLMSWLLRGVAPRMPHGT